MWEKNPPKYDPNDGTPSWLGFTPFQFRFVAFANWVMSAFSKKVRKSHLFKTPLDRTEVYIPKSTADFLALLDRRGIPYSNGSKRS